MPLDHYTQGLKHLIEPIRKLPGINTDSP